MMDRNGACEFLQHGINVNSCLVRTGVQSNILTLTVPCGSTFRPVCNLIQGIHELFYIITLSAKVLCLMTTLSDVERALYNSVISLLLRKPHTKELVEKT